MKRESEVRRRHARRVKALEERKRRTRPSRVASSRFYSRAQVPEHGAGLAALLASLGLSKGRTA